MTKKFIALALAVLVTLVTTHANAQVVSAPNSAGGMIVSPYFQANGDGSIYTFIGVTHPSGNTVSSQEGVRLTALGTVTAGTAFVDFTVAAASTQRVFIGTTTSGVCGISGTSAICTTTGTDSIGHIRIQSFRSNPTNKLNVSQLSVWGAIYIPSTKSGFAMEFIGDAHDSQGYGLSASGFLVVDSTGSGANGTAVSSLREVP